MPQTITPKTPLNVTSSPANFDHLILQEGEIVLQNKSITLKIRRLEKA